MELNGQRPSLSVVIPVYNSATILPELISQLHDYLPAMASRFEIILVNDGSRDNSWDVIEQLAGTYPAVRGFTLMRNAGQHNALLCGIRAARCDVTITMDDDLQHPPAELPKLLALLDTGSDVVYGTPATDEHSLWRVIASQVTKIALQGSMGAETARNTSALRAFRTRLRDAFADYRSPYVSIDVLLTWGTTKFTSVAVRHDPRLQGASNYTFKKLLTHAFNMMTGYSVKPLQMASLMGFVCALFGLFVLAYVIGRYIVLGHSVPGFPFLASIIALFSGAQLLALGIIGEYLARMHFRMMERPTYTVRDQTPPTSDTPSTATPC